MFFVFLFRILLFSFVLFAFCPFDKERIWRVVLFVAMILPSVFFCLLIVFVIILMARSA